MKDTIHILSLGCPKNLVDSEVMAAILEKDGFTIVSSPEKARIILINTCAFILPAKEESIEKIFEAARFKSHGKCEYLVVAGCLPQRYGKVLEEELPEVDFFVGTGEIARIVDIIRNLEEAASTGSRSMIGKPDFLMKSSHARLVSTPPYSTYLKIAEGCSNHCSYCVIPSVRGKFRSRKMGDILKEAEILAEKGAKEIIITAQETSAYGRDLREKTGLSTLMKKMAAIEGIKWIRLLYTYPATLTDEIFRTISEEEKICKYIDIPVQHIDDDILCTMNRKGNGDFIRSILKSARKIIPGVALRTSLIVGFPGETPAKFKRLLDFVKETAFDHLGVFEYSREEGTAAAELPRHVSEKTKEARKKIIMEEQAAISFRINQSLIGSVEEMLIEGKSEIPGYSYTGRLQRQAPDIDGVTHIKTKNKKPGDIVKCRIDSADEYDLYGEESAEHEK